jgi:hypothetical protein
MLAAHLACNQAQHTEGVFDSPEKWWEPQRLFSAKPSSPLPYGITVNTYEPK